MQQNTSSYRPIYVSWNLIGTPNKTKQNKKQTNTHTNKAKQNKTKQTKTNPNKTKQNKTKNTCILRKLYPCQLSPSHRIWLYLYGFHYVKIRNFWKLRALLVRRSCNIPLIKRKEKVYMDYNPIESYFETQSVIKAWVRRSSTSRTGPWLVQHLLGNNRRISFCVVRDWLLPPETNATGSYMLFVKGNFHLIIMTFLIIILNL